MNRRQVISLAAALPLTKLRAISMANAQDVSFGEPFAEDMWLRPLGDPYANPIDIIGIAVVNSSPYDPDYQFYLDNLMAIFREYDWGVGYSLDFVRNSIGLDGERRIEVQVTGEAEFQSKGYGPYTGILIQGLDDWTVVVYAESESDPFGAVYSILDEMPDESTAPRFLYPTEAQIERLFGLGWQRLEHGLMFPEVGNSLTLPSQSLRG